MSRWPAALASALIAALLLLVQLADVVAPAMLRHAGWGHLVGNVSALLLIGAPLERRIGRWHLVVLFVAGGLLANQIAMLASAGRDVIGASGAVAAWLGAGATLGRGTLLAACWLALQGILALASLDGGTIAWPAHLAGFGVGAAYAVLLTVARRRRAAAAKR